MNTDTSKLSHLLTQIDVFTFREIDFAKFFIWFLTEWHGKEDCLMAEIIECFKVTGVGVPNQSRLRERLRKSPDVTAGRVSGSFRLNFKALKKYHTQYVNLLPTSSSPEDMIRERLDVSNTPLLTSEAIGDAYKMGQVYVALHCLENSVRNLIRKVLKEKLGEDWWNKAASTDMKNTLTNRKIQEAKKRWLTSRGADELNYIDWGDLVTIIRKFPQHFEKFIGTTKFAELRLEELENLRNVIAHNGILPNEEITRVELYFKDWCKQVQ
jgi:hypothetical protein